MVEKKISERDGILRCDYCKYASLFHCGHPQHWVGKFRKECSFFEALPNGEMRKKVPETLPCSKCRKEISLEELRSGAKGSSFLCKRCSEE